ncbi:MAG: YkgJ family cysteine cluster protein [Deltaproteobacteria bacterium]|nr:YkgJ family cysteine cluster protein [Deltaproteobacteria bacterium]
MADTRNRRARIKLPRIKLAPYPTPADYAKIAHLPDCLRRFKGSANPCPRCPGHCCELLLSLTVHDIARISVGLTVPPTEFCHLAERRDNWRSPPVSLDGKRLHVMLNCGPIKPCVFLHRMQSQRRCAIYELRPMTCRLYPFKWQQGDLISGPRVVWCPEQWLLDAAARRRITAVIKQSLIEEEESALAIKGFSEQQRQPQTVDGFMRYAVEEGARLLGLDAGEVLAPPQPRRLRKALW